MAYVPNPTGELADDEEEMAEDFADAPVAYRTRGSVIRFNRGCGAVEWRYVYLNVAEFLKLLVLVPYSICSVVASIERCFFSKFTPVKMFK
jgi:hypothetical protein